MSAAIMLLGTLVPIMAASVFYIGDRRAARPGRGEVTGAGTGDQAHAKRG
jgi:hypothetical protein